MLRIIAGEYGSRRIKTLEGKDTRPTLEKTKGAIFNKIGPFFTGGTFLDLFSGSGNMGLEAISRGMERAVLIDKSPQAVRIIRENVKEMKVEEKCEVKCASYKSYLSQCDEQFDVLFLDPPYKLNAYEEAVGMILERDLLKKDGWIILESDKDRTYDFSQLDIHIEKEAVYGITKITYLKRGIL